MCAQLLGCVRLFGNPMKCNPPASLSMEFSRQEDQSGLPFSTPGDLPDPRIKPTSLVSPAFVGGLEMLGDSSLHLLAMRTSTEDINFSASFLFQFLNHDITMYTHIWWDIYGRIHRYLYRYAWSRKWQPTPGFLPGKSCGQRSLAGYSPWDHRVRHDLVTKPPPPYRYACIYVFIMSFPGGASGEEPACQCRRCERCGFNPWIRKIPWGGHGHPLQYPCLENPHGQRRLSGYISLGNSLGREAWWATVQSVAKSQTQLKKLRADAYLYRLYI